MEDQEITWIREEPIDQKETPVEATSNGVCVAEVKEIEKDEEGIEWIREEPSKPPESPSVRDSETEGFDLSECERRLNEATQDTKDLVGKLCEKTNELENNNAKISRELSAQRAILNEPAPENGVHKTIEDETQVPIVSELPSGGLPRNVESVLIGDGVVQFVSGAIVLPTGLVLVTDLAVGILLFDLQGNVVKKISNPDWLNPRSPIFHKDHLMILLDLKIDGQLVRHIFKFSVHLEYIARIEGPKWLLDRTVISDRISIAHTDYLYLSACGEICSAVYELSPVGQWTELDFRQSESYIDMLAFATVGPITQLLVVEGRKNYVLQISVRESQVVERRRIAICERPGALARDDAGRLFVADRYSSSIHLVDTIRWVSAKNLAITDTMVPHFSACWGLLAIPIKNAIRLQKYSFR